MDPDKRSGNNLSEDKKSRRSFILNYLRDFTANTSLHGLKYIGEPSRYLFERIFWFVMLVCSISMCAMLIKSLYTKWSLTPVIVSFGESLVPVWEAPFPAVTVCPKNKILNNIYNFSLENINRYMESEMEDAESEKFEDISVLCANPFPWNTTRIFGNSSIVENIFTVAPTLSSFLPTCIWREKLSKYNIFSRVITNKGVCYTFNALSADDLFRKENLHTDYAYTEETRDVNGWSLEHGYSPDTPPGEEYPIRGRDFGSSPDLQLHFVLRESHFNPLCDGTLQGYEVLLHNPAERPRFFRYQFEVDPGIKMNVAIKLNLVSSSDSLRSYDPVSRQCYFPTERYLRYFKIYTQRNCEDECRANYTLAMCQCVAYYMPHFNSPICTANKILCITKAKEDLAQHYMTVDINNRKGATKIPDGQESDMEGIVKRCQCMPTCTTITYDSDRSSTVREDYENAKSSNDNDDDASHVDDLSRGKMAKLNFFFKENEYISVRRSELYGPTDFLANCGGLLGLFLGFSVLSLIEIIYYMTIRLFSTLRSARMSVVVVAEKSRAQRE